MNLTIDRANRLVWVNALLGGLVLYVTLFWMARRAARVMRDQHHALVKAEKLAAVGEMASSIAHSIRNPISSIRSSAELAQEESGHSAKGYLEDIVREVDHFDGWLRDLLSFSHSPSDHDQTASLREIVEGSLDHLRPRLAKQGIELVLDLPGSLPAVHGNGQLLQQVFNSLITNAVEAMPQGGRLTVTAELRRRVVRVRLVDTGTGLSQERLKAVFTPLVSYKRGAGDRAGAGASVVARYGGVLELQSEERIGTTATIELTHGPVTMPHSVLIIDDEETLAKNVKAYLTRYGYEAESAGSGEEGLALLDKFKPDLLLLDLHLPGIGGIEVLKRVRTQAPEVKVIIITGAGSVQDAVDAMKAGAYDYLSKPVILKEIKLLLDKAVGQERIETALAYYQSREAGISGLERLRGESPLIIDLKQRIAKIVEQEKRLTSGTPPSVLISGETGTGKELVARAFHFDGPRREKPFVAINCTAIPAELIEAELFGFERGAFTDAKARKLGLAEAANAGTLFLDEIGDLGGAVQGKLLRVLEDKTVRRLGSVHGHEVDVRIIAATNVDLQQKVRSGEFRSDLFFRLCTVHIDVPPLRARGEDIILLARDFLEAEATRYGKAELRFNRAAEDELRRYTWPGNVRELGVAHK